MGCNSSKSEALKWDRPPNTKGFSHFSCLLPWRDPQEEHRPVPRLSTRFFGYGSKFKPQESDRRCSSSNPPFPKVPFQGCPIFEPRPLARNPGKRFRPISPREPQETKPSPAAVLLQNLQDPKARRTSAAGNQEREASVFLDGPYPPPPFPMAPDESSPVNSNRGETPPRIGRVH